MARRPAVALSCLLVALLASVGLLGAASPVRAATAPTLPSDPNQRGAIALCGPSNQMVTGGLLDTTPFVWKAVSTQAPDAMYQGPGQIAILYAFQERPDVPPSGWSGDSLGANTKYDQNDHPTFQATSKDFSLRTLVNEYPPIGAGYYQLRMQIGRQFVGTDERTYPATTIQVTGNSWHVVSGGTADCAKATGKSGEVYAGVATADPAPGYVAEVAAASKAASSATSSSTVPTSPTSTDSTSTSTTAPTTPTASARHAGHGLAAGWIALAALGGLALLASAFLLGRRRRA